MDKYEFKPILDEPENKKQEIPDTFNIKEAFEKGIPLKFPDKKNKNFKFPEEIAKNSSVSYHKFKVEFIDENGLEYSTINTIIPLQENNSGENILGQKQAVKSDLLKNSTDNELYRMEFRVPIRLRKTIYQPEVDKEVTLFTKSGSHQITIKIYQSQIIRTNSCGYILFTKKGNVLSGNMVDFNKFNLIIDKKTYRKIKKNKENIFF
jgi:hypothetical protein